MKISKKVLALIILVSGIIGFLVVLPVHYALEETSGEKFYMAGPHGQDNRTSPQRAGLRGLDLLRLCAKLDRYRVIGDEFGAEAFRLGTHTRHQIRPQDTLGETREVVCYGVC